VQSSGVSLVLLRGLLPELPLTRGTMLTARVLDARTLLISGVRVGARLPDGLEVGQVLRLRVEEATGERLHLRIVEQPQPQQAAAPPHAPPPEAHALALPGGATARIFVEPDQEGDDAGRSSEGRAVVVRYDSPGLGRMDVRLDFGAAAVHVAAGEPAERVRAAARELAAALERAQGRPVQVTVHPREDVLDVRA
jgi:hypothetical protein